MSKDIDKILAAMRHPETGTQRIAPVARQYDVAFDSLPEMQKIRLQRDFAAMIGLTVPYYREHLGRSGARAKLENRDVINFASYDYLGLNGHPEINAAAATAITTHGTSVSASRISAGERAVHRTLELALAAVYETDDCIAFNSGHAGGVSTIAALMGPKDLIVHDSLIHNCIVVGAQLSGATRRNFPHNDLDALASLLAAERDRFERVLIVAEGLYSMDGDGPDLARLAEIKSRYGAWLMIDDAHGLGVLGKTGRGLFEHQHIAPGLADLWFGTLSKTLVGCGGYVAGNAAAIDLLKCHAPGFVYSVGMPASTAAASAKALEIMLREPDRVARLQHLSQYFLAKAATAGLDTGTAWGYAIIPVYIGETVRTLQVAQQLFEQGVNAFPILPPGVPERTARLRFFINATHEESDIDHAISALSGILSA
jgi:8-amino-7-oxononanoate synthase